MAFRWSDDTTAADTSGTEAPASDTATQPALTLIDLDPDELEVLIDGLSRVRCRPGEDGLPFAVIHLTLIGYGLNAGAGEVTRRYIQSTIRDGDIAVRMGDHAVAVLCGGLFFPGDIEVVGERIRTQVFQARQVLFNLEELTIVAAGALAAAGEDLADFLRRAGSAHQHAIGTARTDVLVDYVQHALAR